MANEILKLGYESGIALLARQDQTLGNVRNRATALFSATTVATSLAAAVGLLNNDRGKESMIPYPAAVALIVIVVLVGVASLFIVWPVDWVHGPNPAAFPPVATTLDEDTFRSSAIEHLAKGVSENERKLRRRQHALEVAIALLVIELVVVVFSVSSAR
jgi:hypothetical protein